MADRVYMVEFKLPQFEWTHWAACATLDEAEQSLAARRREMTDLGDKYARFRIVKHEIIESDIAGPVDIEKCAAGHIFIKLPSHPKKGEASQCPYCLYADVNRLQKNLDDNDKFVKELQEDLSKAQNQVAKLVGIVCGLVRTADRTTAAEAIAEYEKYEREYKHYE
jgi:hypothetical protein